MELRLNYSRIKRTISEYIPPGIDRADHSQLEEGGRPMDRMQELKSPCGCDEKKSEQIVRGDWIQDGDVCPHCGSTNTWHYTGTIQVRMSGSRLCCACGWMWD